MSECEDCEQLDYAAIVGDAMRMERERIIKLLESIRVGDDWIGRDYAIELIKGEEITNGK